MMTLNTFNLPDVGEGLTEAEIVQWKVAPGAPVAVNDVICEIETAKSLVELSSPFAGTVSELLVPEGETIEVGTPIISVEDGGAGATGSGGDSSSAASAREGGQGGTAAAVATGAGQVADQEDPAGPAADAPVPVPEMPGEIAGAVSGEDDAGSTDAAAPGAAPVESTPGPLVGTGPKADAVKRRPRKPQPASGTAGGGEASDVGRPPLAGDAARSPAEQENPRPADRTAVPAGEPATRGGQATEHAPRTNPLNQLINRVLAKPPVRKAARDLGINLADVPATGSAGEVTKQDLISYQSQRDAEQDGADSFWSDRKLLGGGGRVERIPVKGVRKATAKAMVQSAFTAPHVSIFVDVDASRTMEFVKRLKASRDFEGIRVSPLLILAKAVIWAAARNPSVNATWAGDEILVKHFMNLGIAAATPRGLMVPNIKNAQDLSLKELALALNELATTARAGRTQPAQMQGGTLTITNIGALGIDTGTPIINPGEVAIVAFGTIKQKPWVLDGEVIPRWITTLGGSFDHRVVDGDLSARFMADVASILEEPALLLD
jgi:2-oxoisovalerate dehydrogenase E2 component (dihydrolipoyl transacylase)